MAEASARGTVERIEPTKAQRASARRAAESKATIPHLHLATDVAMGQAQELFGLDEKGPGTLEVVIRAVAIALRETPRVNGAYRDGAAEIYSRVNVGVTVAGAEAPAVPTIFDADRKGLAEITAHWRRLEARALDGTLTAADLAGGTFTVAGAGPPIRSYATVINGGQAANLGIGALSERVVAGEGGPVVVPGFTATLAADARMIDAGIATEFLGRLRANLEAPARLV